MSKVLEWLWDVAVEMILNELGFTQNLSEGKVWPRVWWVGCGLLNMLPIHAAGYHDATPPRSVIDRVMSSYTTTVQSLAYARERVSRFHPQKALLVGMPNTPDQKNLPFVEAEIIELRLLLGSRMETTVLHEPVRAEVLSTISEYTVVHLSCHGYTSLSNPSQSRLLLSDWKISPLTVSDLMALKVESGQVVYLSACNTARSQDLMLLDESIHLVSAVQLAGYPSVVGTLWQVTDKDSPEVARNVYARMFGGGDKLDPRHAAEGLHWAVKNLREKTRKPPAGFSRKLPSDPLVWSPYIHFGI